MSKLKSVKDKPRVFIVSDISNEPDDAESLCRYLLYANEFETRGLVACTSTWMKRVVHPEDMVKIVKAYSKVVDNLNAHTHPENPYPSGGEILSLIKSGPALYGKEALQPDVPLSEGSKLLIERLEESSKPLWVLCWGGTNVLAQAFQHISKTHSPESAAQLRSRLRVYAISDQDDTGMWIRLTYPDIFYINSVHGWNQYGLAAWTGIAGEKYYGFDSGGPDFTKCTKEWIKEHIQIGDLGSAYPDYMFIPEGDTPTFLYLIQNGLGSPEHPDWGSWGGRYLTTDLGEAGKHFSDTVDRVIGVDGREHVSNQATVWRWRDAYQNDFAARMQWTLTPDFAKARHHPVIVIDSPSSSSTSSYPGDPSPVYISAEAGTTLTLDASSTYDPDTNNDDTLSYTWTHYVDPSAIQWSIHFEVPTVTFDAANKSGSAVSVTLPPADKVAVDLFTRVPVKKGKILHFILEVKKTDMGDMALRSYKRFVVQITNEELKGASGKAAESVMEVWENAKAEDAK